MPRPPLSFRLKSQDTKELEALLHGGVQQVRVVLRALALLHLHPGGQRAGRGAAGLGAPPSGSEDRASLPRGRVGPGPL